MQKESCSHFTEWTEVGCDMWSKHNNCRADIWGRDIYELY